MGEAAFVRCEEVIATPRRMGAGLLGQQEWSLQGRFGCPPQIGGSSRGHAGVLFFFAWTSIFNYRGSSRSLLEVDHSQATDPKPSTSRLLSGQAHLLG